MKKKLITLITGTTLAIMLTISTAFAADYTVVKNDSLYSISKMFASTVTTLMKDNNLNSSYIYPGQVLEVAADTHTVRSGDSLFTIAKQYQIPFSFLLQVNSQLGDIIYPGQQVLLPARFSVVPYTAEELDLLGRLISAEAKGESFETMVAVGAVVINRVQSNQWPNTISSVINHIAGGYYQFTPVKNGQIHNPATKEAQQAALSALSGRDPSNGAMFFYDNSSTNQWLRSKPVTARIGAMIFAQ